jgi:hypothetical protein
VFFSHETFNDQSKGLFSEDVIEHGSISGEVLRAEYGS